MDDTLNELIKEQAVVGDKIAARYGDSQPKVGTIIPVVPTRGFDSYANGCVHNSKWQYASARKRLKGTGHWNAPAPFPVNLIQQFERMEQVEGQDKRFTFGIQSDPFQWFELRYRSTERMLIAADYLDIRFNIETMSDLVAHYDYIGLVAKHTVIMNMGSGSDEEQERLDSPGAPSLKRRRIAVKRLIEHGVKVKLKVRGRVRDVTPMDYVGLEASDAGTPRTFNEIEMAKTRERALQHVGRITEPGHVPVCSGNVVSLDLYRQRRAS